MGISGNVVGRHPGANFGDGGYSYTAPHTHPRYMVEFQLVEEEVSAQVVTYSYDQGFYPPKKLEVRRLGTNPTRSRFHSRLSPKKGIFVRTRWAVLTDRYKWSISYNLYKWPQNKWV